MAVKPIPEGYHSVTPYLSVRGASEALEFYRKAFGAEELTRMPMPDGKIAHAEMRIGDSVIMLADEFPDTGFSAPPTIGGTTSLIMIYVDDVDVTFKRALASGGKETRPLTDQFYGDRSGTLVDPFGHVWTVATHVEDVSPEEMEKRMRDLPPPE